MSRRKGPTPKRGTRRAAPRVHVLDLEGADLDAVLEAMAGAAGPFGDDCPVCRAAGIEVLDNGQVRKR